MAKNCEDTVSRICGIIFECDGLADDLPDSLTSFISEFNDTEFDVLKNADKKCDFKSIINKHTSNLIAKRRLKGYADSFRDDNVDEHWNNTFFLKVLHEIRKYNQDFTETDIYWIKEIIDCRFWTIKNVGYITDYSIERSQREFLKMYERITEEYEKLSTKLSNEYEDLRIKAENAEKKVNEISSNFSAAEARVNIAVSSTNNLIPNMLTSLGIFVTIIVAIMALYLSNVLQISSLEFAVPQMRYARYVLSGQITFNTIFLLLYFISKLTGKSLRASRLTDDECSLLKKLSPLRSSWISDPLMWIINIVCVLAYIFLFDWWMYSNYLHSQIVSIIGLSNVSFNAGVFWISLLCIIIISSVPILFIILFNNSTNKKWKTILDENVKND